MHEHALDHVDRHRRRRFAPAPVPGVREAAFGRPWPAFGRSWPGPMEKINYLYFLGLLKFYMGELACLSSSVVAGQPLSCPDTQTRPGRLADVYVVAA